MFISSECSEDQKNVYNIRHILNTIVKIEPQKPALYSPSRHNIKSEKYM